MFQMHPNSSLNIYTYTNMHNTADSLNGTDKYIIGSFYRCMNVLNKSSITDKTAIDWI